MTVRNLVLLSALIVAGCSSSADGGQDDAGTTTTTTIVSVLPDCTAISANARGLAGELRRLVAGASTMDQVRVAADALAVAVEDARTTVGPDARALFDEAGVAVAQVQDSLDADPVDWDGVRDGTDTLVGALRDVSTVCDPAPTS